ncbi:MAG: PrsW family glutamic-type intramembrane protease, partial [Pseudomonadota bacterium]
MTAAGVLLLLPALGFAPGLFFLYYFYKKDRIEPEPLFMIRNCFVMGMIAVIPAMILEWPFTGMGVFLVCIVGPVVEEVVKFTTVRLTVYKHAEFDEPLDGVVYSASTALGFASLENLFYLVSA